MMKRITPGDKRRVREFSWEGMTSQDIIPSLEQFRGSREAMERYCLDLMNRSLLESGKIEFDEYEEI